MHSVASAAVGAPWPMDPIAFLRAFHDHGDHFQVATIDPATGRIEARPATANTVEALRPWIAGATGKLNVYFCPNRLRTAMGRKASKDDVAALACFHVDIDPRDRHDPQAERARIRADLEASSPRPSVIIDSGNGFQAFWKLRRPIPVSGNAEVLEATNRRVADYFAADSCHTLEHLMRLPGTINVPDARKRAKGRTETRAVLVHFDPAAVYELADFDNVPPPALREVLSDDAKFRARWHGSTEGLHDTSRSGRDMSITRMLVRRGWDDGAIRAALDAFPHGKARKEDDRYLSRMLAKAREAEAPVDGAVILPSDHVPFTQAAGPIFARFADRRELFMRGNAMVERNGSALELVTPHGFRSRVEKLGPTVGHVSYKGEAALKPKRLSADSAKTLMESEAARDLLPPIRLVIRAPLLTMVEGVSVVLGPGYNEEAGGVLVDAAAMPPEVPVAEAAEALRDLHRDFDFLTPGDEARAFAALITPALRMGGLLSGPCPIDVAEADQSQAGKGYRQRLVRRIYNEHGYPVARRQGGVGSVDESLSSALLSGRPFVTLDNMRGKVDSEYLEMVTTWDSDVAVRVPHKGEVHVNASGVTFQLTSNGVEMTRDLANRSSVVRIRKRPRGYAYHAWPEGDLIRHVQANQSYYLGCVHAVVQAWIEAGCPATDGVDHDMRAWAGAADWIVRNLFGCSCGLIEGHTSAQDRVSNPDLVWLRALALAAMEDGRDGQELSASALVELSEVAGLELPRVRGRRLDDEQAARHVGTIMSRLFNKAEGDVIEVDGMTFERVQKDEYNDRAKRNLPVKRYIVRATAPSAPSAPTAVGHILATRNSNFHESKGSYCTWCTGADDDQCGACRFNEDDGCAHGHTTPPPGCPDRTDMF